MDTNKSDLKYVGKSYIREDVYDKARGKIYYIALNGQTGKICGKLPVDRKKIIILFFSVFLPLFLLLMTGGYFLG